MDNNDSVLKIIDSHDTVKKKKVTVYVRKKCDGSAISGDTIQNGLTHKTDSDILPVEYFLSLPTNMLLSSRMNVFQKLCVLRKKGGTDADAIALTEASFENANIAYRSRKHDVETMLAMDTPCIGRDLKREMRLLIKPVHINPHVSVGGRDMYKLRMIKIAARKARIHKETLKSVTRHMRPGSSSNTKRFSHGVRYRFSQGGLCTPK